MDAQNAQILINFILAKVNSIYQDINLPNTVLHEVNQILRIN